MKVTYFQQAPYRHLPADFHRRHPSVVTTPYFAYVEPRLMQQDLLAFVSEMMHAAREGFDGVALTEHGQSSYDVMPNPNLIAATLATMTQFEGLPIAINVLGRSLGKSREPLRVAEEYAVIDCLSGGRLIAGFPVGLSYDANQNAGIPPILTRERYFEARALVEKAWSAREPFAWNGKHFKYPQVNPWPRPIQQPKPPIWVPGVGSPKTMADILEREDTYVYLSWFGPKLTGPRIFDRFWQTADTLGRDRNPYRLAFLQVVCVGESDATAERDYAGHVEAHFRNGLGSIPPSGLMLPGYTEIGGVEAMMRDPGDLGLVARIREASFAEMAEAQVAIVGGSDTVAAQIEAFARRFNIGHLLVMLQLGTMPEALTKQNISLFARHVLPRLHGVWAEEGWPELSWPAALGAGTPPQPAKTAA
jgi:alkanesulfonate monooxygenase SsuD/methylene tetrahydromethanopterin reductase-like flavin-dependent oxidoreductase (luciferase family)